MTVQATSTAKPKRKPKQLDFAAVAAQYVVDVLEGRQVAPRLVRLACQRQADDLARTDFPYQYDGELGARACRYISLLPHVKGEKAKRGMNLDLEPWQIFIICTVFGWTHRELGTRRYVRAATWVPRGNGKSPLASGVALYMLRGDGEFGAEVYSAATKKEQARIVFGDAQAMLRRRTDLATRLGLDVGQHSIVHLPSNSKFSPLSSDSTTQDGLNISCAIVDEIHAHKDRGMLDVIDSGSKRASSLLWVISTAGTDQSGVGYQEFTYGRDILEGRKSDDRYFAIIWTEDEGDDPWSEETWAKVNPNYGVSVDPAKVAADANKARQMASAQPEFFTKRLNRWMNADQAWLSMERWAACGDSTLDPAQFALDPCFVGLDLATMNDIASVARVFVRHLPHQDATRAQAGETERHYYCFTTNYLPEGAVEASNNASYRGWSIEGHLRLTQGDATDFAAIEDDICQYRDAFRIEELVFDEWQGEMMRQRLEATGLVCIKQPRTVKAISPIMKEMEAAILQGRFHHANDPVFSWAASNVVAHLDKNDNLFPNKETRANKIDPVIATLMALGRASLANHAAPFFQAL